MLFAANFLKLMNFVFNESTQCFKLQQPFLKRAVFLDTSLILSLTHFQILSFPTDLILLGPFLKKKTIMYYQFFHVFLQQMFKQFFKINFYVLAEEIMVDKVAEVYSQNLFTISYREITMGEQSILFV